MAINITASPLLIGGVKSVLDDLPAKPLYALIAILLIALFSRRSPLSSIPHLNPKRPFELTDTRSKREFIAGARDMLAGWFTANPSKPVRVIADYGEVTVLPPEMADEIRNDERLSFSKWAYEAFHARLPGFEGFREGTRDASIVQSMILRDLTKQLSKVTDPLTEETALTLSELFTENREWHAIPLRQTILRLVARISSRVFLGEQACRNETWLRVTREYTVDVTRAAEQLRLWPAVLRPLVHWFLPACRLARAHVREARRVITPLLEQRRREKSQPKNETQREYNDAIEWLERAAGGKYYDAVSAQLILSLAAIHTTTDLVCQVMTDLAQHPDVVESLRREAETVLAANGWTKAALYNMKLLDSVIKESQRIKPIGIASMRRLALSEITLADGTTIPQNSYLAVSSHSMWDPNTYQNPKTWDPYRFYRLRQAPGKEHAAQLVSTGPDHLAFGHGVHACPGRFFAANEVKIALVNIMLGYEWRLPGGGVPTPRAFGFGLVADPVLAVEVKRRRGIREKA